MTRTIWGLTLVCLLTTGFASGQGLTLTVGNTVAGQDYMMKNAQFIFRVQGCADPSKTQVTATAEGVVRGARRTVPLTLPPSRATGVYSVSPQWGSEGKWLVAISVTCMNQSAGAIVPVAQIGFARDGTQVLQRAPSADEIEAALKAYTPTAPLQ